MYRSMLRTLAYVQSCMLLTPYTLCPIKKYQKTFQISHIKLSQL